MKEEALGSAGKLQTGKRTCQRAWRRLFMACYEFGPSSRGRLAHRLSEAFAGTILRWPAGCANRPVRVVDPSDRLPSFHAPASVCAGRLLAEATNRPAGQRRAARLGSNRDIGTMRRCLNGGLPSNGLFSRLTMCRWQIHYSPATREAGRRFCRDAVASEQFPDAAPATSFPYFPTSNIDAPRGAIGRPTRPSQRIFARGERVSHGQQNDHRRLTPGRDPGGGPARQSSSRNLTSSQRARDPCAGISISPKSPG